MWYTEHVWTVPIRYRTGEAQRFPGEHEGCPLAIYSLLSLAGGAELLRHPQRDVRLRQDEWNLGRLPNDLDPPQVGRQRPDAGGAVRTAQGVGPLAGRGQQFRRC